MRRLFHSLGSSIISRKIVLRILISGVACFAIVLFFSSLVLLPILQNQAISQAGVAITQLATHFSNAQENMEQSADFIAGNLDFNSILDDYLQDPSDQNKGRLSLHLESLIYANSNIFYTALETDGYPLITSVFHSQRASMDKLYSPSYERLRESGFGTYYSPVYQTSEPSVSENRVMRYQVCSMSKNYYITTKKYTLTLFYTMDPTLREARAIYQPAMDDYCVISRSGETIFVPEGSTILTDIPADQLAALQAHSTVKVPGGYAFSAPTENYSWQVIARASNSTLYANFSSIFLTVVLFFVLSSFMTVFFTLPYLLQRMRPLKELSDTMAAYSIGNNAVTSAVKTDDEINEMSQIFNSMVKQNNEYIMELIENENMHQQMKYSLLISQIDPHFIYNTMNIINALARQGKTKEVIAVNRALEKILQDRLRVHDIEIYDTVEHEIDIIRQYVLIMKHRYGNLTDIVYGIDEDVLQESIPKNLIQPLVENAFYHGLTDENGVIPGVITISAYREECSLVIEVADDGVGMDPETLEKLQAGEFFPNEERGRHIGLANVVERIHYLYHTEECIRFESAPGKGTVVQLILAKRRGSNQNC